jgi:hypothetical protein
MQEICSFLKGSAEAIDSPGGRLTLQGYLEVGRKRAPNFNADTRREVYPIFERYEREKLRLNRQALSLPSAQHLHMFLTFTTLTLSASPNCAVLVCECHPANYTFFALAGMITWICCSTSIIA